MFLFLPLFDGWRGIFSDAPPAGEIKVGRDPLRSIRLRLHYVCVVLCVCFAQAGGRRRRGLMMSVTAYARAVRN